MLNLSKVTLFDVGSPFSYETGINGSRRCALYPPVSVSAPFCWYSKLWLRWSQLEIEPDTSRPESRALANWATTAPVVYSQSFITATLLVVLILFSLFLQFPGLFRDDKRCASPMLRSKIVFSWRAYFVFFWKKTRPEIQNLIRIFFPICVCVCDYFYIMYDIGNDYFVS